MSDKPMTAEEIARDRETIAAATSGPWQNSGEHIIQTAHVTRDVWTIPHCDGDMPFIAASRTRWPAALDEIDRLRGVLREIRDTVENGSIVYCGDNVKRILARETGL